MCGCARARRMRVGFKETVRRRTLASAAARGSLARLVPAQGQSPAESPEGSLEHFQEDCDVANVMPGSGQKGKPE